jgi:RNA polymerase sigma-B factor
MTVWNYTSACDIILPTFTYKFLSPYFPRKGFFLIKNREALILQYTQTKDPDIQATLVEAYQPLVEYIARKLTFNRDDLDDLVQVGNIGLLRALRRFNPALDIDFSTFATPNIIGEIKHYFRDKRNIVKIPRKLQETHSKVKNYLKDHQQDAKQPTIAQIAKALELTEEDVLEAMEAGQSVSVVSLDMPGYTKSEMKGGSSGGDSLLDTLGDEPKEDTYLNQISLSQAIQTLTDREQDIVRLRFYNGLSQREIADATGLSQMHISRLLTGILKKLKKHIDR